MIARAAPLRDGTTADVLSGWYRHGRGRRTGPFFGFSSPRVQPTPDNKQTSPRQALLLPDNRKDLFAGPSHGGNLALRKRNNDASSFHLLRPHGKRRTRRSIEGGCRLGCNDSDDRYLCRMGQFDHIAKAMLSSPLVAVFKEMAESNDFSRLESTAKRHHFLPRLLLRRFARPHNGKDCIFQMKTTRRNAPLRVDIRTAASRHRLYAMPDEEGGLSNRHEGYLALVESHAAPALRSLLEDPTGLSPSDRATIAFFVALQTMRTPAAAHQITELVNAAFRISASEWFSDRRAFAAGYREYYGEGASDEEIDGFRQELMASVREGRVRLTTPGGGAFSLGLSHAAEQLPMLFEFDWTLLRAEGGFITSDRAFAIHDPTPQFPWQAQAILSSPNSQTTLPLSDSECLLMRPEPMGGGLTVQEVSADVVEMINLRTYGWADQHIFGATQEDLVSVRKAARQRPADVVRPKPFCHVALLDPDPDDNSLVERNLRRGWPARLPRNGELHDYIVIPADQPHPELWALADGLTERRARKRAGVGDDDPFDGRIINDPLDAIEVLAR